MVVPFGLTNAPSVFMSLMNGVFCRYLNCCVIVFLDDILIYLKTVEEHEVHLRQVLQCLRDHWLYGNLGKCGFFQFEVKYLGHIIIGDGIAVDTQKIQAIMDWLVSTIAPKVCSFMGLAGYYHHFVNDFSQMAHPITSLQRKGKKYVWLDQCKIAFNTLKECLTSAQVLAVPNFVGDFVVCIDASLEDFGLVLMQDGHVIAYESRKHKDCELNYPTHDLELVEMVHALVH